MKMKETVSDSMYMHIKNPKTEYLFTFHIANHS